MVSARLPLKLAVVGGGPSAFYVTSRLLQLLPRNSALGSSLRVHIYDKLWAPHGLVRYGVAPDHPEVKNCTNKFDDTARDPRVRFFGNVNIGSTDASASSLGGINLRLSRLLTHYSHLLLASGCPNPRLHPALLSLDSASGAISVPQSSAALPLCRPALDIVHWYTSHPARPVPPDFSNTRHVTVIGHGNVALDVARILLSHPSRLAEYDIPKAVLDVLERSNIRHVSIIGRRGPLQAAFSPRELREMMRLDDVAFVPIEEGVLQTAEEELKYIESKAKVEPASSDMGARRLQKRIFGIMKEGSKAPYGSTEKTFSIEFFRSPSWASLNPITDANTNRRFVSLKLAHTTLDMPGLLARAIPTGETSIVDTDLVLSSLGYIPDASFFSNGDPPPSSNPASEWLAEPGQSHVRNDGGHILDSRGRLVENAYVSGWAASGAKGVLARTVEDAKAVAEAIVDDFTKACQILDTKDVGSITSGVPLGASTEIGSEQVSKFLSNNPRLALDSIPPEVDHGLAAGTVTTYQDWELVDAEEIRRGHVGLHAKGGKEIAVRKERERMNWEEARSFLLNAKQSNE